MSPDIAMRSRRKSGPAGRFGTGSALSHSGKGAVSTIQGGLRIKGNIDLARFNRPWIEVIHSNQALS